jgi:MarR family transcriptional regulator, organic hydroperoxide resistance regulator
MSRSTAELPLDRSVGYKVRDAHRALQRHLQTRIEPHGVTLGMWYFLRALWAEDGLTQRELSRRVGTMEPTTLNALVAMERRGFVKRVRNDADRRKINIHLTAKGRNLQDKLVPIAVEVVASATDGFSDAEVDTLVGLLGRVSANLDARSALADGKG